MPDPTDLPSVPPPLPGNIALRSWFQEKRGRRAGLAHLLNVSVSTVSGWGRKNQPSYPREPAHVFAIEQLCGIPLAAWIAASELEALSPIIDNWKDHVFAPVTRRPKEDPRQMHIDELIARNEARTAAGAPEPLPEHFGGAAGETEEEPLDIDSMMGDAT
jgi:hypothetical protein